MWAHRCRDSPHQTVPHELPSAQAGCMDDVIVRTLAALLPTARDAASWSGMTGTARSHSAYTNSVSSGCRSGSSPPSCGHFAISPPSRSGNLRTPRPSRCMRCISACSVRTSCCGVEVIVRVHPDTTVSSTCRSDRGAACWMTRSPVSCRLGKRGPTPGRADGQDRNGALCTAKALSGHVRSVRRQQAPPRVAVDRSNTRHKASHYAGRPSRGGTRSSSQSPGAL